jgi:hypothetical protein
MANRGPDTNGSQFFIASQALPHLDGKHTVFGKMTSGHEVFDQIENVPCDANDAPISPVIITFAGIKREAQVEQVALPDGLKEKRSWLDRGGAAPMRLYSKASRRDASGRLVKGRGPINF